MISSSVVLFFCAIFVPVVKLVEGGKLNINSPMPLRMIASGSRGDKPKLTLANLINYGGFILPMGPVCTESMQIALDSIEKANLLPGYDLVIDNYDEMCDHVAGMKMTTTILNTAENSTSNLVPLMVGMLCVEQVYTGMMVQHYNWVELVDTSPLHEIFRERSRFSSFFALLPSFEIFYEAIPAFIKMNGWSNVYLFTETYTYWNPLENVLMYNLAKSNISLAGTSKVFFVPGTIPGPEHFESAVREFAALKPRITILNTNYGAILACWLHRYKLYGPSYVYIVYGPSYFLPNSALRAEGCTDQMLFDVLQSVVYFSYGNAINLDPNAVDALGTNVRDFENALKEKIDQPDLDDKWFYWRAICHSQVIGAAFTLAAVENTLQTSNDTLLNWVTSSENFQKNGSYIHSLIKSSIENLHFKGLSRNEHDRVNSKQGVTGFYQVQIDKGSGNKDLSALIKTVPLAIYDSSDPDAKIVKGAGKAIWPTRDGQAPFDSLRVFVITDPIIDPTSKGLSIGFACVLLLANIALLFFNTCKRRIEAIKNSIPGFNTVILVGNILALFFIFIIPSEANDRFANANCSVATLFLIAGFAMITCTIAIKLHIAHRGAVRIKTKSKGLGLGTGSAAASNRSPTPRVLTPQSTPRTGRHIMISAGSSVSPSPAAPTLTISSSNVKLGAFFAIILICTEMFLAILWLGLVPFQVAKMNRQLEQSATDLSVAYQHVTYVCQVGGSNDNDDGTVSLSVLATLIIIVVLIFLRSIYLAFLLRKSDIPQMNDLAFIRIASYTTALMVVAGGVVSWAFFASDPGRLEIAISVIILFVVSGNTGLIFTPKLRKGYYL